TFDALVSAGATVDREAASTRAVQRGDFVADFRGMRVDVFVPSIPFYASVQGRVAQAILEGRPIRILSAEDLAVFKLLFFRGKDVLDLERLVALRGRSLDLAYVRRWIVEMCGEEDVRIARWDAIVSRFATPSEGT